MLAGRGYEVVVTADALVAGVHFFPDDPPDAIGWKALAVNLSDLAAKGAKPEGFVLTLALPRGWTEIWLAGFAAGLARMAEAYIRGETFPDEAVRAEIAPCFVEEDGRKTDIIVLACTHYPFMANLFRKLAPWPVDWLDPAEAIARQARRLVPPLETLAPGEDIAVFTSGKPDFSTRRLMQGFGLRVV